MKEDILLYLFLFYFLINVTFITVRYHFSHVYVLNNIPVCARVGENHIVSETWNPSMLFSFRSVVLTKTCTKQGIDAAMVPFFITFCLLYSCIKVSAVEKRKFFNVCCSSVAVHKYVHLNI